MKPRRRLVSEVRIIVRDIKRTPRKKHGGQEVHNSRDAKASEAGSKASAVNAAALSGAEDPRRTGLLQSGNETGVHFMPKSQCLQDEMEFYVPCMLAALLPAASVSLRFFPWFGFYIALSYPSACTCIV
ncbi:hypothetical protein K440DRAFT_630508, partial [Wilcoxina mikolae CBS 423.85]